MIRRMKIGIVTPAPPRSQHGNRATAVRWSRILRGLGHRVSIRETYSGEKWDLLIALHARKSAASIARFDRECPGRPLLVALTGTDLYVDLPRGNQSALRSVEAATRLITLQSEAAAELPPRARKKVRVIYQSVPTPSISQAPLASQASSIDRGKSLTPGRRHFDVFVIGHLRAVKDPFRAAMAARGLPAASRIRIQHYGRALSDSMEHRAQQEVQRNDRYHWYGEVPHGRLMRSLASRAALLVQSSRVEGGPHSISEAVVAGVPVLATDIPGSTGLLGKKYPGLFPVGDTKALQSLMIRAEEDSRFYQRLRGDCLRAAARFEPDRERQSWRELLDELA